MKRPTIYTIGHSTRSHEDFAAALASAGVKTLVDVRRFPHSRRQPWFNVDELKRFLFHAGIRYVYAGDELGGFRDARVDSKHRALSGSAFQGYADHMETPMFARGYARLLEEAEASATAFCCSERNYKKCHRRILSDRLAADGWDVRHILDAGVVQEHHRSPAARVEDGVLVYRATALDDF